MTNEAFTIVVLAVVAFAGVVALVPLVRTVAVAYGVTDTPAPGKLHTSSTPYLGGIAVGLAILGASPFLPGWSEQAAAVLVGAALVGVTGLVDDMRLVSPGKRVAVEAAAAAIAFVGGARVELTGTALDFVLTVVALVVLTNSFNLLDNMDGAAGVIGTTTAAMLATSALLSHQVLVGGLAALAAGACLGFLVYNWHPARIFLGDAGSLFVGFLLAAIALKLRFEVEPPASIAALSLLVGPALFDTTLVVVSRVRAGRPIHLGGTDHTSHRLLKLGLGPRAVAALLALSAASCGAVGLAVGTGLLPMAPVVVGMGGAALLALVVLLRMPVYALGAGRPERPVTALVAGAQS